MAAIERLPGESPAAYRAYCDYAAMGSGGKGRSLRDLLAEYVRRSSDDRLTDQPPTTKWGTISTWSIKHDWQRRVQEADNALQEAAQEERTQAYLAALEAHRRRAQEAGEGVYIVATKLLRRMNAELDTLELSPATLGVLLRAYQTALDLEAHSLNIDSLLPALEQGEAR